MKLTMVGHSSIVLADTQTGFSILCDPWLSGRIFNNGWALVPEASISPELLESITHLYISHEHPDHLHFPTLKSLSAKFKDEVTVIFQKLTSDKVPAELSKLGFKNIKLLDHMEEFKINGEISLFIYQHRQLDSALIVKDSERIYVNLNDAELSDKEYSAIAEHFKLPCEILLTQFSIAGSDGVPEKLDEDKRRVSNKLIAQAKALKPKTVVPFASFIYFCMPDNWFVNEHATDAIEIKKLLTENSLNCVLLYPGSSLGDEEFDGIDDEAKYANYYSKTDLKMCGLEDPIPLLDLIDTIEARCRQWRENYPQFILKRIQPIVVEIMDIQEVISINISNCSVSKSSGDAIFLSINSQPLFFAFKFPFGIQTLGVSGRYRIKAPDVSSSWKLLRIVSSLFNAEIYLTAKSLFSPHFIRWVWSRRSNLFRNILQQAQRFSRL